MEKINGKETRACNTCNKEVFSGRDKKASRNKGKLVVLIIGATWIRLRHECKSYTCRETGSESYRSYNFKMAGLSTYVFRFF
jgi:hypothetical protein